MSKVLLIRSSAFKTTRVVRQARELANNGYDVSVLHWERMVDTKHNSTIIGSIDFDCEILEYKKKCSYGRGIYSLFSRLSWFVYIIKTILTGKYRLIHAVDFDSAFPAYLASLLLSNKLIFDIADFIESFDSNIPKPIRRLVSYLTNKVMNNSEFIILPDLNRLEFVPIHLHNKVIIVNNAPHINVDDVIANKVTLRGFDKSKLNVMYYGAFNKDRAVELFIRASKDPDLENVHFWFAGWGALQNSVIENEKENFTYLGRLTPFDALSTLKYMDLSLIFYDPQYEHNQVASPNKIFEAMALGVPIITANNTSIDLLIDKYEIGYRCDYNIASLKETLEKINASDLEQMSINIKDMYQFNCWNISAKNLVDAYNAI